MSTVDPYPLLAALVVAALVVVTCVWWIVFRQHGPGGRGR